ncbi:hypothetical protein WM003_14695 [Klebsiella michiganensis]
MLASAPFPARGVNALAGLPDRRRGGARSPISAALFPARGVNALAGLPNRRRGGARSPAKRSASREEATPMHHPHTVPEAALRACPGYRIADAGEPVAPVSS